MAALPQQCEEPPDTGTNIMFCNVQSLQKRIRPGEINEETEKMKILCLSETWLHDEIEDADLAIPGYLCVERKDRGYDRYGGVATYFSCDMPHVRRKDLEDDDIEIMWNEVHAPDGVFLLGSCYRPPGSPTHLWGRIEVLMERAISTGLPLIMGGDLNEDILQPNSILA